MQNRPRILKILTKIGQMLAVWGWGSGFEKVAIFAAKATPWRESTSFKELYAQVG